jgi:short/branched chain acyl-CoA dehydrogenase
MWITNSYEAEVFLIFANVDPSKGYKGITCFVATKDMGIQIAKKEQKLGIRASSTCTLNFDDLKIPEENIIGGEGKGYKVRRKFYCGAVVVLIVFGRLQLRF